MEFSLFELRKNVKQDSVLWGTCWNSVLSGFLSFIDRVFWPIMGYRLWCKVIQKVMGNAKRNISKEG